MTRKLASVVTSVEDTTPGTQEHWIFGDSQGVTAGSDYVDGPATLSTHLGYAAAIDANYRAIVQVGDVTHDGNATQWAAYVAAIDAYADRSWETGGPIAVSAKGNHETYTGGWSAAWDAVMTGMAARNPESLMVASGAVGLDAGTKLTAVSTGLVRWLIIDTYESWFASVSSWLANEVAIAAHMGQWPVVISHHGPYPSDTLYDDPGLYAPRTLPIVQACDDTGIRLWLSGHGHNYERTIELTNGAASVGGCTYCMVGVTNGATSTAVADRDVQIDGLPSIDEQHQINTVAMFGSGYLDADSSLPVVCRLTATASALTLRAYHVSGAALVLFDTWEIS